MSDPQFKPPNPYDIEVFVARQIGPSPKKKRFIGSTGFWVVLGILGFGMLGFTVMIGSVIWIVASEEQWADADREEDPLGLFDSYEPPVPNGNPQSFASKFMAGPDVEKSHPDFATIEAFGRKLAAIGKEETTPELMALLDIDRLARQVQLTYVKEFRGDYNGIDWKSHHESLRDGVYGPLPFREFAIFRIDDLADDERLVWVHVWDKHGEERPVRWWLKRHDEGWRMYDWHSLHIDHRESYEYAVMWSERDSEKIRGFNRYVDLTNEYLRLGDDPDTDYQSRVVEILNTCEEVPLPDGIYASILYTIARRWYYQDELDEASECLDRFQEWHPYTPGAYWIKGRVRMEQGRYEEAIDSFEKYIEAVGPTAVALQDLIRCHEALDREEEVLATRRELLLFDDSIYSDNLFELLVAVEEEEGRAIIEAVLKLPNAHARIANTATDLGQSLVTTRELEWIVDILRDRHPDWSTRYICEAAICISQREVDTAIELLAQALLVGRPPESPTPEEDGIDYDLASFACSTAFRVNRLPDLMKKAQRAKGLFAFFRGQYYEDDSDWANDDMADQVVEIWLEAEPEHLDANLLKARLLAVRFEFSAAIEILNKVREGEVSDEQDEAIRRLLAIYTYHGGRLEDLEQFELAESTVVSLLWVADARDDVAGLKKLVAKLPQESEMRRFFSAEIDAREGRHAQAAQEWLAMLEEDEGSFGWRIRRQLLRLFDRKNAILDLLETSAGPTIVGQLEQYLRSINDWSTLEKLVAKLRESSRPGVSPDTQADHQTWQQVQLGVLLTRRQYADAIKFAFRWEPTIPYGDPLDDTDIEQVIHVGLKIGQADAVEPLLDRIGDRELAKLSRARIALYREDIERFAEAYGELPQYRRDRLSSDLARCSDKFRSYKLKHAEYRLWEDSYNNVATVLLPRKLDVRDVVDQSMLEQVFGAGSDIRFLKVEPTQNAVVAQAGPYRMSVALNEAVHERQSDVLRERVRQALEKTTHLLTIVVSMDEVPDREDDSEWMAVKLAQQFLGHGLLGLRLRGICLLPDNLRSIGESKVELFRQVQRTPYSWLGLSSKEERRDPLDELELLRQAYAACLKELTDAATQTAETRNEPSETEGLAEQVYLLADYHLGQARERLKLRVLSLKRQRYGPPTIVAELVDGSKWNPRLKAGSIISLVFGDIVGLAKADD